MPTLRGSRDTTWASVHMDAVRGVAALVVVLGHTRDLFFESLTAPAEPMTRLGGAAAPIPRISIGNEAVMIFFVLSGFLVGGSVLRSAHRQRWSWAEYLTRRLTRLWVVLLPALVIGLVLDVLGQHWFSNLASIYSGPSGQVLVHDLAARLNLATFLANVFFLQDIWFPTAGTNESLWSLTNEFWYYILFPLLVFTVIRRSGHGINRFLCGMGAICVLYWVGKPIALLFPIWLLGAGVYTVPLRWAPRTARRLAGVLACAFPVLAIVVRRSALPVYVAEWIIALCFSALLYLILHDLRPAGRGLYSGLAGFFSRISYSLYLSHLPFAVLGCALLNSPWRRWHLIPRYIAQYVALNVVLIAIAYFFYLAFESRTDQVRSFVERCFRLCGVRPTVPAE